MEFDKQKFLLWVKENSNYDELSARATEVFTGWSASDGTVLFEKIDSLVALFKEVTEIVEKFARTVDDLSGKDKLEVAVQFIDDLVKFPFFLEFADDIAIKWVLSTVVSLKNEYVGKDWFKDEDNS